MLSLLLLELSPLVEIGASGARLMLMNTHDAMMNDVKDVY